MNILEFFGLFGGLALFLHGMQMMSSGLEAAAGNRMKTILERLTANRFMGILVGALITAAVQSSSATTVMVVGFVNAGIMNLNQAVWLIMGANVGKTTTGLLIALDVGALAPIVAFAGVFMMVFLKKPNLQHIGQLLAGLGILFIGMDMMSAAMEPLREVPAFVNMMATLSNPILGILFGTVFTALIQSSAASVGILQTLAAAGVVQFSSSVYILFGQNIGTCITAVMASVGVSRDAKRATCVHVLFNVIGTVIFTVVVMVTPLTALIEATVAGPMAQIAVMHVFFNLATTLLLIPFGSSLARLATRILPDLPQAVEEKETEKGMRLAYLTPVTAGGKDGGLGVSAIVVDQLRNELHRMLEMARQNVDASFKAVMDKDVIPLDRVEKREQYIDFLNKEISRYISHLIAIETNERGSAIVSSFFSIAGNIERIGDHAENLADSAATRIREGVELSDKAKKQLKDMMKDVITLLEYSLDMFTNSNQEHMKEILALEDQIDEQERSLQKVHVKRLAKNKCTPMSGMIFSDTVSGLERVADHATNIAFAIIEPFDSRKEEKLDEEV